MTMPRSQSRPTVRQRLGRTWQDPAWRKLRLGAHDVTARAQAALQRLCPPRPSTVADDDHRHALARTPVPLPLEADHGHAGLSRPQTVRGFA